MRKAVFCLVESEAHAQKIVDRILSSGFNNSDISLLSSHETLTTYRSNENFEENKRRKKGHLTTEKHTKAPEGASAGAVAGGILGGSLGLLAGIGVLAIPGLGPLVAAGPLLAALSGSAAGGSLGLLIGALAGAGVPEYEAKKYEEGLREGNILMSVQVNSDQELKRVQEIMKEEGAKGISSLHEKTKSKF